jgi:dipeptidase
MEILRNPQFLNRATKYGQVAQLRKDMPNELSVLWIAMGPPGASVYIPYYLGISSVPLEFGEHRYLTKGEALKMELARERQGQETTTYAYRLFDKLFMLSDEHYDEYHPEVIATFHAFEDQLISRQEDIESIALQLLHAGKPDLAQRFLTYYCETEALKGLRLARTLADSIEMRTRLRFGIRSLPSLRENSPDLKAVFY